MQKTINTKNLVFRALTGERWDDFVQLFGPHGAYGGCWCMFWRMTRKEFNQNCGENNKQAMEELVKAGTVPGIIGYLEGQPATWCSIAPREDFTSLERSRNLKRIDDKPVWSIVCFFIAKNTRSIGLMQETIEGAVAYACQNGAQIVEAYPLDVKEHKPSGDLYMGNLGSFLRAGFSEVETRGRHKIVRWSRA